MEKEIPGSAGDGPETEKQPAPNSRCPACGREFDCGIVGGQGGCWCMAMPAGMPVPAAGSCCFCPDCLAGKRREARARQSPP